ncbi:MAG: mechanosensitive ion channel family protein [Ardenticatenaceae bacterium]|nr:mechanosensitive ion channel family protein [Anaerolineales bacterium]MCB8921387.1 mechanosensitive ion channel family protein [Ardenticatenaceae bacterium]MCB8991509.1 mechanosensitive ion channel family protein [Ardenticatenaceae bacterium]MCB9003989.1 mechanosensitive ion channel family protein [Ardenticatenaceae bacterium]
MNTWQHIQALLTGTTWWHYALRIGLNFLLAWVIHRLGHRIAARLTFFARRQTRPERRQTVNSLVASTISFLAFASAALFSLAIFVDSDTIVWMVGLFSAAFGLGARPLLSDFLTGVGFLFEDPFDLGEKVEMLGIEGVVEQVNLRTTLLRAPTGELYTIPNGEIRVIRNFSRGRFSMANISLKVQAGDLQQTLALLSQLGDEAVHLLPNLLEPWQVISQSGAIGQQTELTLVTKARFGKAAEMRPRLLALVQERLEQEHIELVD